MNDLYRLVQASGFCFRAFGLVGGVRLNKPDMLGKIKERLPPGWRTWPTGPVDQIYSFFFNPAVRNQKVRRFHILYRNSQVLARSENEEDLLEEFQRQVSLYVAETCRSKCFVHAGVVGWKGEAIVIPGPSFSGKTTLVMEFLKQGASYYSDEFAIFDRRGYVYPFPKPLGTRDKRTDKQIALPAAALTREVGIEPLPVGLILVTRYQEAASWRPRRISAGNGVLKLLANALSGRTNPSGALLSLGKAAARAEVLSGSRGEAREVVLKILGRSDKSHQKGGCQ